MSPKLKIPTCGSFAIEKNLHKYFNKSSQDLKEGIGMFQIIYLIDCRNFYFLPKLNIPLNHI